MKKPLTLLLILFITLSLKSQISPPTLTAGLDKISYTKGGLDVDLLAEIIASKQDELKKEWVKRVLINSIPNNSFVLKHYTQNTLNLLLNEQNKDVIKKELFEYTTNLAVVYGFTEFYLQTKWVKKENSIKDPFFELLDALRDYPNYIDTSNTYIDTLQNLRNWKNKNEKIKLNLLNTLVPIKYNYNEIEITRKINNCKSIKEINYVLNEEYQKIICGKKIDNILIDELPDSMIIYKNIESNFIVNIPETLFLKNREWKKYIMTNLYLELDTRIDGTQEIIKYINIIKYNKEKIRSTKDKLLLNYYNSININCYSKIEILIEEHKTIAKKYLKKLSNLNKGKSGEAFNLILLDMVFDICYHSEPVRKLGFFQQSLGMNDNDYKQNSSYHKLSDDYFPLEELEEVRKEMENLLKVFFKHYLIIDEIGFFNKSKSNNNVKDFIDYYKDKVSILGFKEIRIILEEKDKDNILSKIPLGMDVFKADYEKNLDILNNVDLFMNIEMLENKNTFYNYLKSEILLINNIYTTTGKIDPVYVSVIKNNCLQQIDKLKEVEKTLKLLSIDILTKNIESFRKIPFKLGEHIYPSYTNSKDIIKKYQKEEITLAMYNNALKEKPLKKYKIAVRLAYYFSKLNNEFNEIINYNIDTSEIKTSLRDRLDELGLICNKIESVLLSYTPVADDNTENLIYKIKGVIDEDLGDCIKKMHTTKELIFTKKNDLIDKYEVYEAELVKRLTESLELILLEPEEFKLTNYYIDNIKEAIKDVNISYNKNITKKDREILGNVYRDISILEDEKISTKLKLEFIKYYKDSIIPDLINLNSHFVSDSNINEILRFSENLIYKSMSYIIEDIKKDTTYLNLLNKDISKKFIEFIVKLNELDNPETYEYIFDMLTDAGYMIANEHGSEAFNEMVNNVKRYTTIDTKEKQLNLDVESMIIHLSDKYGNLGRRTSVYFSVGMNQYFYNYTKSDLKSFNKDTIATNLSFAFASEKLGFKLKIWDINRQRTLKYDWWNRPSDKYKAKYYSDKPIVNDIHFIAYGSGLLYNIVNTTTSENFKSPMIGIGFGTTFFNSMDFNVGVNYPIIKDERFFPMYPLIYGFSFDIKITEYLSELNKKRKMNKYYKENEQN